MAGFGVGEYDWGMVRESEFSFGLKWLLISITVIPPLIWLAWPFSLAMIIGGTPIAVILTMRILEAKFIREGRQDLLVRMGRIIVVFTFVSLMAIVVGPTAWWASKQRFRSAPHWDRDPSPESLLRLRQAHDKLVVGAEQGVIDEELQITDTIPPRTQSE